MINNKVVYTVITVGYDKLTPQPKADGWDYICFTDNPELKSDFWQIRMIPEKLNYLSNVKKQRCIKLMAHKYLSEYDLSIYIDGNITILGDINAFVEKNCTEDKGYFFIGKHPERDCIYDEALACVMWKKDTLENVSLNINSYASENFPKHYGLGQSCILIRYHNNQNCIKLDEFWWNEVLNKSHRDQLSLFYSKWKTKTDIVLLDTSIFKGNYFIWNKSHKKV